MLKTLNYILISLVLSFVFTRLNAQVQTDKMTGGVSIGIDLSPFIVTAFEPERQGVAFLGRLHFKEKWFTIAEVGFNRVQFEKNAYGYESNGSYLRLGFDYDFFKVEEEGNNDNILVGMRYGLALQDHRSPQYKISDGYWGDFSGNFGNKTVNSHWVELVFGLRTEVLKNFFMAWSIRMRKVFVVNSKNELEPYVIPGYGRRDNSVNLGFTYTLEYQFPFRKRK